MSHVVCHMSYVTFYFEKLKLVGGESVINRTTPSSFLRTQLETTRLFLDLKDSDELGLAPQLLGENLHLLRLLLQQIVLRLGTLALARKTVGERITMTKVATRGNYTVGCGQ